MRILIPMDGSKTSLEAVREVAGEPWPEGSRARVLFALDLYPTYPPPAMTAERYAEIETLERARAKMFLDEATSLLKRGGFADGDVSTSVVVGRPKHVILDEAAAWGADLIAIGSHGEGTIRHLLLGSVAHPVALHAPCSVRIVRPRSG